MRKLNYVYLGLLFLIALAYMVSRAWIYSLFSDEAGFDWFMRDTFMTIPRAVGVLMALVILVKGWGWTQFRPMFQGTAAAVFLGVVLLVIDSLCTFTVPGFDEIGIRWLLTYAGTTAVVAVFEELLFRGTFLNSLRDLWDSKTAVIGSSFVFMLIHFQAQPYSVWPYIFLFGLIASVMRIKGTSLFWLIALHWLVDMAQLWGFGAIANWTVLSFVQIVLMCLTLWFVVSRHFRMFLDVSPGKFSEATRTLLD